MRSISQGNAIYSIIHVLDYALEIESGKIIKCRWTFEYELKFSVGLFKVKS